MPAAVFDIKKAVGDRVAEGETVIVLEAMKMEMPIAAPCAGVVQEILVGKGDQVAAGQVVAYMGESGQASGPHLHFEIWRQGEAVDPRTVVAGDPPRN